MSYKVRKANDPKGLKQKMKYYFLGEKRKVVGYNIVYNNKDIVTHSQIIVKGDFKKLFISKKFYDYIKNVRVFRETEYQGKELIRDVIVKKDGINNILEFQKMEADGKYSFYRKKYDDKIKVMLEDRNIVYSSENFINWDEKIEEFEKIETPSMQKIGRMN